MRSGGKIVKAYFVKKRASVGIPYCLGHTFELLKRSVSSKRGLFFIWDGDHKNLNNDVCKEDGWLPWFLES